ncbi:MAG: SRPBCC family protein [Phycisphaeraceae bacterium]|nr:SRPBCC family protein [Phycisphaeraceae bacterium]
MAMCEIRETFDFPPDRVFAEFTDLHRLTDRIESITGMEVLTDGPFGVGTRWRETRVMFGREHTEEMWVAEFTPGRGYAVLAESCGCQYRTEFTFAPSGAATEVSMRFSAKPLTFMAKVMSPLGFLFSGMMKKAMRKDFDDLRRALAERA